VHARTDAMCTHALTPCARTHTRRGHALAPWARTHTIVATEIVQPRGKKEVKKHQKEPGRG
jgi:hypothetical protein